MTDNDRSVEWDSNLDRFYGPYDPNSRTKVAAGCGDERHATPETMHMMNKDIQGNVERDGYARWFGGLAGMAEVFALTIVAQHGIGALSQFGETFGDLMAFIDERTRERTNIVPYNHGECAFIQNEGVITYKAGHATNVLERSRRHQDSFFGEDVPQFTRIITSASTVAAVYGSDPIDVNGVTMPRDLGITEQNMSLSREPMHLVGHHVELDRTGIDLNYIPRTVGNLFRIWQPRGMGGLGIGRFGGEPVILAENLMKAVPEAQLDPALLLRVIDHLAIVTGDELEVNLGGTLKISRRGTAKEAIAYLQQVASTLSPLQATVLPTASQARHL
jgi:hypothetical protein